MDSKGGNPLLNDLYLGYANNVNIESAWYISQNKRKDTYTNLQRDVALVRGLFGIDWRETKPSELFELINEAWLFLFATGKYKMTFENGVHELVLVTF